MDSRVLSKSVTDELPEDFPLSKGRYGFGLSWEVQPECPKVDVDLQCVVIDDAGVIIDCAYYNNLKAARAVTHSGDEDDGDKSGIDEQVWVQMKKLPKNVSMLVFVVAAYTGGSLADIVNGVFHIFDGSIKNEVARSVLESSSGSVDVVAAMFKGPEGWMLRVIQEPAEEGQHFMDVLPLIGNVVRAFIPTAPKTQKVAFAVSKGGVMDLPKGMEGITVGLGWDTGEEEDVDLDVSAVMLAEDGSEVDTVFFGRPESEEHGIVHGGDNLTGDGAGDDEQIVVNLGTVGEAVRQVVFVINIYTEGQSFGSVRGAYARVIDNATGSEMCRYALSESGSGNGLVVAKVAREVGGRWGFHALGLPCSGRTYKDSLSYIQEACLRKTREFGDPEKKGDIIRDVFAAYDTNGDNIITKDELGTVLRRLDDSWTDKKVHLLLQDMDANRDGKIDYEEFVAWLMGSGSASGARQAVRQAGSAEQASNDPDP